MSNIIYSDYSKFDGLDPEDVITGLNGNFFIRKDEFTKNGITYYQIRALDFFGNKVEIYRSENEERRDEVFDKLKTSLKVVVL